MGEEPNKVLSGMQALRLDVSVASSAAASGHEGGRQFFL